MIIVNDASSDNSFLEIEAFLKSFQNENIKSITHNINQGKGAGIHSGLKIATGDWIVIQDVLLFLVSIVLLVIKPFGLSATGNILIAVVAFVVLVFAICQYQGIQKLQRE